MRDKNSFSLKSFDSFVSKAESMRSCDSSKSNNKKIIIILLLILLIVLLFGGAKTLIDENAKAGAYAGMSEQEKIDYLNKRALEGMIDVNVAANIVFSQGPNGPGKARFVNESSNSLSQKFTLHLRDDDTVLYESGIVDPGFWIEDIYLNEYVMPGQYDAVVSITAFESDHKTAIGEIDADVKLTICDEVT